ncbi:agmatine deiminase family protein [Parasphingorhabdus flavimaris]|uniref:Agmatine deiminase family protein n=1 Tax=Parasphingorhabdus flavimaris TaxID=266812 RepID=A0ABX2N0X7_9SPHN|nr:agmatine deiminase family protein [Parasphingorhabdus flavimaris]NVD27377.1 agmatine deiminase family protein [Parasphingorhabdus flavimaris]|tara:strand:- start:18348 stop:19328 length:981 start_codon:yes stop_codon:yes gene_type:complete
MRWPAEWEPHQAVWIGFPGDPAEWPAGREAAQREVAAFADAIADDGAGEAVVLVCRDAADQDIARSLVQPCVNLVVEPFGDIWLRDSAPVFVAGPSGLDGRNFRFNGWGGKYEMAGDQDIGQRLAQRFDLPVSEQDWILEGGAIDGDGAGRLITTAQCVLNPNRNDGLDREQVAGRLRDALAVQDICWLGDGLAADHTDGHVDNLARFVAPNRVAIPQADNADDPNEAIFDDAAARAAASGLQVVRLPSAGRYEVDGDIAPASYMNFYIGNRVVAVPQYGAANDAKAVDQISALFPDHKVIGLSSQALLRGGGSFHCISQQIPQTD